ncbi:MAG: hypothetical protein LBD84_00560 [Campylobacteraceae bacterium]|jgi:hypothetical protein|nr:hypothetical protein [Campylobacteraceae bacterium]
MKKIIAVSNVIFILLALICPVLSIVYIYEDTITENVVGFLWILPGAFIFYELLKYNRMVTSQSIDIKLPKESEEIKAKIKIKISIDMLENISLIYMILITIIGSISLYDDKDHNDLIILGIFCTVILNAFSHLNLPKYKRLLLNTDERTKRRLAKCINNLYTKAIKIVLGKTIVSLFILFAFAMPIVAAAIIAVMFVYHEEYILTMLFSGIFIIMLISLFAAMIYYISNLSETITEKKSNHLPETITIIAICLYLFGSRNNG